MPLLQVNVKTSEPAAVPETVIVPLAGCVPLQAPLALQLVPLVADHMSVEGCPATTVVGLKFIVSEAGVIAPDGAWYPPPPQLSRMPTQRMPVSPQKAVGNFFMNDPRVGRYGCGFKR